jgi:beta-glucosidase
MIHRTSGVASRIGTVAALVFLTITSLAQIDADVRAEAILKRMTTEEKVDLVGGVDDFFIRAIPQLGIPRLKMADGPIGVRNFGPATTMAGGISLAATWNPALAEQVGTQIGRDARAKGVHFLLGPGVNIYVAPMNGRNFEYFGEDPFLGSRIAVSYIRGVQSQGVSATVKHFMGNNSEYDRHNVDDIVDERTMREIYLPIFEAAVREAHVGAIMDSYNLTNGAHMTQNGPLNLDLAKKEWGFSGILMSDWDATYDAVAAANGGLDLEMPSGKFLNRTNLLPAIQQGKVSIATVDEKVRRTLRTAIEFGWFERDQTELSIPRYNLEGRQVALETAREGMVLLKNEGGLLPLKRELLKSITVIGPDAYPAVPVGGGSARVEPFVAVSFLQGLASRMGNGATTYYRRGIPTHSEIALATNFVIAASNGGPGLRLEIFDNPDLRGTPVVTRTEAHVNENPGFDGATLNAPSGYSLRWSGYYIPTAAGNHDVFVEGPGEGGGYRMYIDDKVVMDDWLESRELTAQAHVQLTAAPHTIVLEQYRRSKFDRTRIRMGIAREDTLVDPAARALAAKSDVVILAVGYDPETESEGADRTFALPIGQDELIREITTANKSAIVVVTSGGSVDMRRWLDRVPALIEAWYPGEEGGTALADILLGEVNPSGRLPVSFESRWEDNPAHDSYYPDQGTRRVVYRDGVFVGYRGYQHNRVHPLFPFGYGLSYTTFKYGNLAIKPASGGNRGALYEVSFDVTNTGTVAGAEVAQVYIGEERAKVPRPPKELKGFAKISLHPGETRRVTIPLGARAFAYYDAEAKHWRAEAADFNVMVGRSVEQIELTGTITLPQPLTTD